MLKRFTNLLLISFLLVLVVNCANRGRPDGGPKDETPPVILKTEPENQSINFNGNEIKIYFDEYVKIKNLQQNLIISPPMDPEPEITPFGSASKYITIKILDTLQEDTTYAFNFGESIVDNNENNPYPFYRYVFSTGDYIDSLQVKGTVVDALKREVDDFISVMLYDVDSTFTDSVIYNQKPKYITNTLDSTYFQLDNIKAGNYLMVALKDENSNYTYEPKSDKIGFLSSFISVPTDSAYTVKMFKEELDFRATRPSMISGQKIAFGFEGDAKNMKIKLLSEASNDFESIITQDTERDTLYYWYKPKLEVDSLLFEVSNVDYVDTLTVRIKEQFKDTLDFNPITRTNLLFTEDFKLNTNIPLTSFDQTKATLLNQDSVKVDFQYSYDNYENVATFKIDKKENETYNFQFLPGAFTDFFGKPNDSLNYSVRTRTYSDYGDARISLTNAQYPVIVQLVDQQNNLKYERYALDNSPIELRHIQPGIYYLRVIYDTNKNGKFDAGNYLLKRLPERVSYDPEPLEIRANWGEIINFRLLD